MVAGFAAQETDRAVLGIDGSATVAQTWAQIARIARATAEAIELGRELDDSEIVLLDDGTQARTASRTRRRSTPFVCAPAWKECSPIPSTREVDGGADRPRPSGRIAPGSRVLYAHLGGQPALNAYAGGFQR